MNGQTGRMVGELPCSKPKLALATLIFFIVAFVVTRFACMGSNAFNPAYFDLTSRPFSSTSSFPL